MQEKQIALQHFKSTLCFSLIFKTLQLLLKFSHNYWTITLSHLNQLPIAFYVNVFRNVDTHITNQNLIDELNWKMKTRKMGQRYLVRT